MAIVAALYPLWGAVWIAVVSSYFLGASEIPSTSKAVLILLVWLIPSVVEEPVLRIPRGRHILGAVVLSLCWFPLMSRGELYRVIFISEAVSRAAAIAFVWVSRPDRQGMALAARMNTVSAAIALACGAAIALNWSIRGAVIMILACFLIVRVVREWCYRRFGGINTTAVSLVQRATDLTTVLLAVFVPLGTAP